MAFSTKEYLFISVFVVAAIVAGFALGVLKGAGPPENADEIAASQEREARHVARYDSLQAETDSLRIRANVAEDNLDDIIRILPRLANVTNRTIITFDSSRAAFAADSTVENCVRALNNCEEVVEAITQERDTLRTALDTSLVVSSIRRVALDSLQLGVGNLLAARMEDSTQFSLLSEDYGSLSRQIAWMKVRAWVERGVAVAVAIAVYLFLSSTSSQ